MIRYSDQVFGLSEKVWRGVRDQRPQPRIPTPVVLQAALVLFWARLGSLNALEMVRGACFWKRWLGRPMGSADTRGRVHTRLENQGPGEGLHTCMAG